MIRKRRDSYAPTGPRIRSTFTPPCRDVRSHPSELISLNDTYRMAWITRRRMLGWTGEQIANVLNSWLP